MRRLVGGDRGVAPVIGVILVVAIVVILASVVAIYALSFGDDAPEPAPNVRFDAVYDERPNPNGEYLNVSVEGGDRAPTDNLEFEVSGATDGSGSDLSLDNSPIDQAGDDLVTGDTISINATSFDISDSDHLDLSDTRVDLVWDPDPDSAEPGQTQPIWTWEDE